MDYSGVLVHDVSQEKAGPLVLTSQTDSDINSFLELHDMAMNFSFLEEIEASEEEPEKGIIISESQSNLRDRLLNDVSVIFSGEEHNRRLFTSCLWLFRALASSRAIDSLLYATIALEVLLGDREMADRVGLTKLLSNRCAYLLGSTRKERDEIMAKFKHVYDIRSQIVHSGLHNFNREAVSASITAKTLASRVIVKETILSR